MSKIVWMESIIPFWLYVGFFITFLIDLITGGVPLKGGMWKDTLTLFAPPIRLKVGLGRISGIRQEKKTGYPARHAE